MSKHQKQINVVMLIIVSYMLSAFSLSLLYVWITVPYIGEYIARLPFYNNFQSFFEYNILIGTILILSLFAFFRKKADVLISNILRSITIVIATIVSAYILIPPLILILGVTISVITYLGKTISLLDPNFEISSPFGLGIYILYPIHAGTVISLATIPYFLRKQNNKNHISKSLSLFY